MIKKIYIIDYYEKNTTGFSTYKDSLFRCLYELNNILIGHILFNYPCEEFHIKKDGKIIQYFFPEIRNIDNNKYLNLVEPLMRIYIKDSSNTLFFINAAPYYEEVNKLKILYPLSKVIIIIHDLIWASLLLGNTDIFKEIIKYKNTDNKNRLIYDSYEDGRKSFNMVDKVVCLSYDTYELLHNSYKIELCKLCLIKNGLVDSYVKISKEEKIRLKKSLFIDLNTNVLLFVGRVCEQKGVFALLKAFEKLLSIHQNCVLVIAGTFDENKLNTIKNSLRSKILFLGNINKEDLYTWYKITDVGIISSYYEQCSYSGIEMMMHSIPIVASDGFGIRNMFNNNNATIAPIFSYTNDSIYKDNLTFSLLKNLECRPYIENMKEKSRENYENNYTINKMKEKYQSLIESL